AGSSQSWGQYLEAAPAGWSGQAQDPKVKWCATDQPGYKTVLQTSTAIGSGRANTAVIIGVCGNQSAAGAAAAYTGGGLSDWFLPSKDELAQLYNQRGVVGGLAHGYSWSSSQSESYWGDAWDQSYEGIQGGNTKNTDLRVRAVRAF
ncbi:MAG: hypothetical protein ACKOW5_17435, partial [Actinomycetales bacterium]